MRILFTASPLTGHVLPMLPLAAAAVRAGHEVVVATGADLQADLQRRGFTTWAVGPTLPEIRAAMERSGPRRGDASDEEQVLANGLGLFVRPAAARAVELMERTRTWRPDIVVQELYELGGGYVQPATGVRAIHGLGVDYPRFGELVAFCHAELARLLDRPNAHAGYTDATYLDPFPAGLQPADRPWRTVLPIRPEVGAVPRGSVLPDSFTRLRHRQTIYLTLGTVFSTVESIRPAIDALSDLPINVLVTVGDAVEPNALGPVGGNVAVASFVPQALVLPHCSAVVCHAGAGTVIGGLAHGLPQVLLPMGADQFGNAAAVAAAGAGIVLPPEQATPQAVRAAVQQVLSQESYRRAAQGLAAEIAATPTADEIIAELTDCLLAAAG